jgi:HSP20 family protein
MVRLVKQEPKEVEPVDVFHRFDRMFDDWTKMLPFRRPTFFGREWLPEEMIRVDEFRENEALVVRAEVPGIDPETDVEITVSDGMLKIEAERREEKKTEKKGSVRQELRYGSFSRSLRLPEGVNRSDITATYNNGILEIRIPSPAPVPATKIPIARA